MMITSKRQARQAIENGEIEVGTLLTSVEGTYQVTAINPKSNLVVEAVEVEFTEEGEVIPFRPENTYRWTLADLEQMEL